MTSKRVERKALTRCYRGRHILGCGPRHARHVKVERLRCSALSHIKGCGPRNARHDSPVQARARQKKEARRAAFEAKRTARQSLVTVAIGESGISTHPRIEGPQTEHESEANNRSGQAIQAEYAVPAVLRPFAGIDCPCPCEIATDPRPFGHDPVCVDWVLDAYMDDDGFTPAVADIQAMIPDAAAFRKAMHLGQLQAGRYRSPTVDAFDAEHANITWDDTSCTDDEHYPDRPPSWQLTKEGWKDVLDHKHRDVDSRCTVCFAEADARSDDVSSDPVNQKCPVCRLKEAPGAYCSHCAATGDWRLLKSLWP